MSDYLIFGGTGSLGKKLIQRLLPTSHIVVYSRDEAKHWSLRNEFAGHPQLKNLDMRVGDIRDSARVKDVIRDVCPKTIIIAAALKQVDTCELSPNESILTNLIGTQNVISAVNDLQMMNCIKNILFVSTDKACSPVNVYGMCKAISERVVTSRVKTTGDTDTSPKFLAVRYGNVLESRGSIIPLFKYQAEHGEFLTVTDPEMTRYVMTLDNSVDLILKTLERGASGETWIPCLPAMKVGDLADIFSKRYNKPIKIIGLRPGEKKHEDLINESESVRTRRIDENYIISPAFNAGNGKRFTYSSSDDVMNRETLEQHLTKLGILDMPLDKFQGLTIEEIVTNRKE